MFINWLVVLLYNRSNSTAQVLHFNRSTLPGIERNDHPIGQSSIVPDVWHSPAASQENGHNESTLKAGWCCLNLIFGL